jgi:hypothetical protein
MVRIIVEGDDDVKFIISLLSNLRKDKKIDVEANINFNTFIQKMGNKSKLLDISKYDEISKLVSKKIEKVLFIFDSDFEKDDNNCNGLENSKKCIEKLIENLNWQIDCDYYIFDRNLDYFLLETINDKKCYDDFNNLIKCLDVETIKPNKKPIANLYRDLYPYPKFDYKDKDFNPLKTKLENLFK